MTLPLFAFDEEPTEAPGVDEAPEPDVAWKLSVRLYIEEIEQVAEGRLPESLIDYCRDGLIALRGTEAEALLRANQRLRESRMKEQTA